MPSVTRNRFPIKNLLIVQTLTYVETSYLST